MIYDRQLALQVLFVAEPGETIADVLAGIAAWMRESNPPLQRLHSLSYETVDGLAVVRVSFDDRAASQTFTGRSRLRPTVPDRLP